MAFNKKASKIYKFFLLKTTFFWLKFVGILFVGKIFVRIYFVISIIPSRITELSTILPKYLLFSQLHVAGFQI